MRLRVRDHVNPFTSQLQVLPEPLDFAAIFENPAQSLHIDIGCALGQFALEMARQKPSWNFLGLEIRETVIVKARRLAAETRGNLHYEFCNATIALDNLLKHAPDDVLQTATIQFPDPWFKKRHFKRRMVQPRLIADLSGKMVSSGKVFVQSDVESLAVEMSEMFAANGNFRCLHQSEWLTENPLPVKTEREKVIEAGNLPIFRLLFERV